MQARRSPGRVSLVKRCRSDSTRRWKKGGIPIQAFVWIWNLVFAIHLVSSGNRSDTVHHNYLLDLGHKIETVHAEPLEKPEF